MDAAEEDRRRPGGRGLAGEPERVADVVGDVLHLGALVVVREDDRVTLARERAHLVGEEAGLGGAHGASTSSETASERAEWVSAPTEIESTPVSA